MFFKSWPNIYSRTYVHPLCLYNGCRHARTCKSGLPCLDANVPFFHLLSGRCVCLLLKLSAGNFPLLKPLSFGFKLFRTLVQLESASFYLVLEFRKQGLTQALSVLAKTVKMLLESSARNTTPSSHCQKRLRITSFVMSRK